MSFSLSVPYRQEYVGSGGRTVETGLSVEGTVLKQAVSFTPHCLFFRRDAKSWLSLLSLSRGKCVTYSGLANSREGSSENK